jgi:polyisoprenoid-binding protein YceI
MKRIIFLVLVLASVHVYAQGIFKCNEGEISFFSETSVENIDARNKNISSFINTSTKEVVFVVPIRNFKFKSSLMEEHFNEKYLESDKYPDAIFQGKINEDLDFAKDGEYKVTAAGTMKMHGVEKAVTPSGTLTIKNGTLALKCEFNVALKDYNIIVPKLVVANIAEVIPVKLNANYVPYKK